MTTPNEHTRRKATYAKMRQSLIDALDDLEILAGNVVGPSGASWQEIAGTCATNFQVLAWQLEAARQGNHESAIVFPSAKDWAEERA
jgi:hypothetical protein